MRRENRSFIAVLRLACLAMLLSTLAPAVSGWLAAAQAGPGWDDVCISPGPTGGSPDRPGAPAHLTHCPYCLPHGGAWAPPPPATALLTPGTIVREVPPLFLQGPRPRLAWIAAQPRAPPPTGVSA